MKEIFLFYCEIVCCVYSLELPLRVHSTYNHCVENQKDSPKLSLLASWTGAMINPQWLELPMSKTNFHGPKDVRAIEVRLYLELWSGSTLFAQACLPHLGKYTFLVITVH